MDVTRYTRSSCAHCEARAGLYLADCRGCAARSVARGPQFAEAKRLRDREHPPYVRRLAEAKLTHDEVQAAARQMAGAKP